MKNKNLFDNWNNTFKNVLNVNNIVFDFSVPFEEFTNALIFSTEAVKGDIFKLQ